MMTAETLVFATNNKHKLDEVRSILQGQFVIRSLEEIGCMDDIPESGNTLEANAKLKSDFVRERYNLDCFADDSGLEIDSLNGEPGVYSARYGGSRDMNKNIDLVFEKLAGAADTKAQFRTVISLFLRGQQYFFEGIIRGTIILERRGSAGFGYDPIFMPEGYDKTFAEMTPTKKNQISHRAIAVKKLVDFLLTSD